MAETAPIRLTWRKNCVLDLMIRSFTLTALAGIALTACSIQFDSQYGLRLEPAERGARSTDIQSAPAAPAVTNEALQNSDWSTAAEPYTAHILEPSHAVPLYNLDQDALANVANEPIPANLANLANEPIPANLANEPIPANLANEPIPANLAPPQPEQNMLTAWIMWGVPVLLMLTGAGFLLNFGLHWYYLGKNRRANTATFIWALTVAASVIVWFLNAIHLGLFAALVGVVVLLPLVVIQLIRAVKDAILLNKIAKRRERNPFKGSRKSA
jgi:hypothetical protein